MRSCGESRRRARLAAVAAVMVLGALAACSNYTEHAVRIRAALARGDWDAALEAADAIGDGSPLLRALERGTILHEAGRWERSDAEFDVADSLFDALYTRSVRRELAALAVSETIREYAGAPHEPLFVQFYQVLNRLRRGDVEGAGVECRQLAGWLQRLRDDPDDGIDDAPFLHYLCGVVFDRVGEREDALVSLRVAAAAYGRLGDVLHVEAPPRLACDTLRLSGDRGDAACPPPGPDAGTVLVLVEAGTVARLVEVGATVPIYRDDEWDEPEAFAGVLAARHGHEVDAWAPVGGARFAWRRPWRPTWTRWRSRRGATACPRSWLGRSSARSSSMRPAARPPGTTGHWGVSSTWSGWSPNAPTRAPGRRCPRGSSWRARRFRRGSGRSACAPPTRTVARGASAYCAHALPRSLCPRRAGGDRRRLGV